MQEPFAVGGGAGLGVCRLRGPLLPVEEGRRGPKPRDGLQKWGRPHPTAGVETQPSLYNPREQLE